MSILAFNYWLEINTERCILLKLCSILMLYYPTGTMVTVMSNPTAMATVAADTVAMETAMAQAMVAMETAMALDTVAMEATVSIVPAMVDMETVTNKQ
jgi:hypothetical protein